MKKIIPLALITAALIVFTSCIPALKPPASEPFQSDTSSFISGKTETEYCPDTHPGEDGSLPDSNHEYDDPAEEDHYPTTFMDVPALGPFLEETGRKVRLYFRNGKFTGSEIFDDGSGKTGEYTDIYPVGGGIPYELTEYALTNYPDFRIVGYVYNNNEPFQEIYPIGINGTGAHIQYFYNNPVDFRLVYPFSTVEEGRKAFEEYHRKYAEIAAEIPVFPWNSIDYDYLTYTVNTIVQTKIFTDSSLGNWKFGELYDTWIPLPLLNENGEEGIYITYLLYCKNDLVAELVYNYADTSAPLEYLNYAKYDKKSGKFSPLTSARYTEAAKNAGTGSPLTGMKWINGSYRPVR